MNIYDFAKKHLPISECQQSRLWSDDIYSHAVIWRNWSLLIAISGMVIALCSLIVLLNILPLKENTPFLIFVDNEKGEPVTIKPIVTDDLIENESLKKYMIRKFVIARERYMLDTINEDAQTVSVLSSASVQHDYQQRLSKDNPLSPQHLHKNSQVDVGKMNIMFLNEHRAYVSFVLIVMQDGGIKPINANADIKFDFSNKTFAENDANVINPVNFEVLSYQSHQQTNLEVSP